MSEITLSQLQKAHKRSAQIVAEFGVRYLPIFERLEKELKNRKKQAELYRRAIEINTPNSTQNLTQNSTQKEN